MEKAAGLRLAPPHSCADHPDLLLLLLALVAAAAADSENEKLQIDYPEIPRAAAVSAKTVVRAVTTLSIVDVNH